MIEKHKHNMKFWFLLPLFLTFSMLFSIPVVFAFPHWQNFDFNNPGFEQPYGNPISNFCPYYDPWPNMTSWRAGNLTYSGVWSNLGGGLVQYICVDDTTLSLGSDMTVKLSFYANPSDFGTYSGAQILYFGQATGWAGNPGVQCQPTGKTLKNTLSNVFTNDTYNYYETTLTLQVDTDCGVDGYGTLIYFETPGWTKILMDEIHLEIVNVTYGTPPIEPISNTTQSPINWPTITGSEYSNFLNLFTSVGFFSFIILVGLGVVVEKETDGKMEGKGFMAMMIMGIIFLTIFGILPSWIFIIFIIIAGILFARFMGIGGKKNE